MSPSPPLPDLVVVDTVDDHVADHARRLLAAALPAEERDDRFEAWPGDAPTADGFVAVLASLGDTPVGFLGGHHDGATIALDVLIDGDTDPDPAATAAAMYDLVRPVLDALGVDRVEVWARPARPWHETLAGERELTEHRALHQMRCTLPVPDEPVPTRAFVDGDLDDLRSVNNRAFATHPDQGSQTTEALRATMAEPWFRADGVRVFELDGRMAGFCWTKIHPSPPAATELGEIYVIGVDPDFHGKGYGVPMTAAGLAWLADQGITTGMLYVEADNVPAIRTYERLGFSVLRTDRAWLAPDRTDGP